MQAPKLSWTELQLAVLWILGAGFAAVVAFFTMLQPVADNAWDRCFGRNAAKAKARIREMFAEEIERWDQASVDAGAALQVLQSLEQLTAAVERQGAALERISGFLEGSTGWNGIERRRDDE